MGCCPSKHKAGKGGGDLSSYNEYASTGKIDVGLALNERPASATLPVYEDVAAAAAARDAPSNMLMDRGDGVAIERSDHESNNHECVAITIAVEEEDNQANHETVRPAEKTVGPVKDAVDATPMLPPIDIIHEARDTPAPPSARAATSPARSPTSPSKTAVNFEDMPINSMYHRIHVVEVEEMETKRRQEQREDAERREREIEEFKAAIRASTEG